MKPPSWPLAGALVLAVVVSSAALGAAFPAVLRIPPLHPRAVAALPPALFSHRAHGAFACNACHPGTFPQAVGGFTHEDMQGGRFCGACHQGRTAFAIAGAACTRCHVDAP